MKIAVGSDHGGFALKEAVKKHLEAKGIEVEDFGCYSTESVDYAVYGAKVAHCVADGKADYGVLVCSTGIGGPSTAIAVEELAACGAHTFLRVGTCGGIDLAVMGGDLVVATGAVRQEGTTLHYMPLEYPAVADFDVVDALRLGAQSTGANVHVGVVQSKDSFYGQHEPGRMPVAPELEYKWNAWKKAGVLCSEMESAALFVVSAVLGLRAGALFAVLWNQERRQAGLSDPHCMDTTIAIEGAVEGLKCLIMRDTAE